MNRTRGSHALWTWVAVAAGILTWGALLSFAPIPRTWIVLGVVAAVPYLVGPFRPGDGWWLGAAALAATVWWLVLGAGHPLWQPAVVALLLAVHWVASAWVAQAPRWATHANGYLTRRLGFGLAYLGVTLGGLLLVLLTIAVAPLPGGELWALLGALVLLAGIAAAGFLQQRR